MRASEDEATQLLPMMQRELLRDHPPHRDAEQCRARDAEGVHQARGVIGHLLDGVGRVGLIGASGAAIVEHDAFIMARNSSICSYQDSRFEARPRISTSVRGPAPCTS